jgi:GTPase SAR1 family protein
VPPPSLYVADTYLVEKNYTPERLAIVRLSGNDLPMDQCYINLALTEHHAKHADRSDDAKEVASLRSSPFSLDARLKVETPHKDLLVTLPTLFDRREIPDRGIQQPKRILIRGRAGVGKTTLCKKIVHDFTHGTMWQGLFQRLIWVQLRDLKTLPEEKHTLGGLLQHIQFQESTSHDVLYEVLAQHIEQTKSKDTLFLLDGLDEVSDTATRRKQSPKDTRHEFLTGLLNKPNVIITTRPHTALPPDVEKPHLELDTMGFSPEEVDKYLERVISDTESVVAIQSYLRKNRLMQSLVRIPIQLDALCYIWEMTNSDVVIQTMTSAYIEITRQLWLKDIERLGKLPGLGLVDIPDAVIEAHSSVESEFLGKLAFSGLLGNLIEFQQGHRNALLKSMKSKNADVEWLEDM